MADKITQVIAELITQAQGPLWAIVALSGILGVGYPFIIGDEQAQQKAKRKILYILLGATIVAAASYWARWVVSVANF